MSDPELAATASVVVDLEIVEVVVTPADPTLEAGLTQQMTAEAFAVGDVPVFGTTFTWTTSNELVAPVGSDGVVTARYVGSAVVTAATEGVSGSAEVAVSQGLPHYATAGNTQLATGAFTPPATAHAYDADNVLAPTPGLVVSSTGTITTAQQGTVELEADGDFSYVPPLAFQGTDAFDLAVESGETATVTIEVAGMVWYVDKRFEGVGLSTDPLNDGNFGPSPIGDPGDIIFVHHADGALHDQGFVLLDGQQLLGEGYGLELPGLGVIVPPGLPARIGGDDWEAIVVANDTRVAGVTITGAAGFAITGTAVGGVTVEQVRIDDSVSPPDGVSLIDPTGSYTFTDLEMAGVSGDGIIVDGGDAQIVVQLGSAGLSGATGNALRVVNTIAGSLSISGGPIVESGTGIFIDNAAGFVEVLSPLQVLNPSRTGISITTSSGDVTFADVDVTTTNQTGIATTSNTGTITLNGSVNTTGAAGLDAQSVSGPSGPINATFSSFVVVNDGGLNRGRGLFMARNPGVVEIDYLDIQTGAGVAPTAIDLLDVSYGGALRVLDPTSRIVAAAGDALSVGAGAFSREGGLTYPVDITAATLESGGPNTSYAVGGIALRGVDGAVTIAGGAIDKSGLSVAVTHGGTVDLDYGGTVTNATGDPAGVARILVNAQAGGSATFRGLVTSNETGIQITNNALGTSVVFSGGLDLQTALNPAFTATGGGQVEVTGGPNVIVTTTGQGVLIDGTVIGPAGVTFESVSVDGAQSGIGLVNTGALGGFTVTGTGDFSTGGVIANTVGDGVYASGTTGLSLVHVFVQSPNDAGVRVDGSSGVMLHDVQVEGAYSDGVALLGVEDFTMTSSAVVGPSEVGSGLTIFDPVGSYLLDDVSVSNLSGDGLYVLANAGSSSISVIGSSFDVSSQGVEVVTAGESDLVFSMSGSSAASSSFEGIVALADESSTMDFTLESSMLTAAVDSYAALVTSQQSGTVCVDIRDNMVMVEPEGIQLQQLVGSTFQMERLLGGDGTTDTPAVVDPQILADNPSLGNVNNLVQIQDQIVGVPDGSCRTAP